MRKLHDQLTLQINKVNISVDRDRLKYDQNERGKIVDVTVLDNDGLTAYDLTGKSIRFFDLKQGTPPKIISDDGSTPTGGKFIRTPENDRLGKFSYQFQEYTYQRSGEAHFEFYTDKDHVDVTSHFAIDIIAEGQIAPDNSSYVSSMAELIDQLKAATDHASDSIGALTTVSDTAKKAANDAIQAMKDQVVAYAKQVTDAQASWTAQSKKINDDAANQLANLKTKDQNEIATAIKSIADQRDAAISDLNKKAQDQLGSIQSDYNAWKSKTVADFNATIDSIKRSIEKNTADTDAVAKSVQSATAQMNNLKQNFDKIDFTLYAHKDDLTEGYVELPVEGSERQQLQGHDGKALSFKKPFIDYDATLSKQGAAADAYAVGRRISDLDTGLTQLNQEIYKTFDTKENAQDLKNGILANADANNRQDGQINGLITRANEIESGVINNTRTIRILNHDSKSLATHANAAITARTEYIKTDSTLSDYGAVANAGKVGETIKQTFLILNASVTGLSTKVDSVVTKLSDDNLAKTAKTLSDRIAILETKKPIKAISQDDAIAKSKNSNDFYYW